MRVTLLVSLLLALPSNLAAEPLPLIYDTDIGNDIDDVLALAMLYSYMDQGRVDLLCVTVSKDNEWTGPFVDLMNHFYGYPNLPIGVVDNGPTPEDGKYLKPVATKRAEDGSLLYPRKVQSNSELPAAVGLLRRTLAGQNDNSVVLVVVGFSTNIARLLESPPDEYSRLTGRELVKRKVKLLSLMGGKFLYPEFEGGDYNIVMDPEAARVVFDKWPAKIVASGCALGTKVAYPVSSINNDFDFMENHPVVDAYNLYTEQDRPSWDLTSVLYGVEPDMGYFDVSLPGRLVVDAGNEGRWLFLKEGNHFFLSAGPVQLQQMKERFVELVTTPPRARLKME